MQNHPRKGFRDLAIESICSYVGIIILVVLVDKGFSVFAKLTNTLKFSERIKISRNLGNESESLGCVVDQVTIHFANLFAYIFL